jgi:hypothetical protein
MIKNVCIYVSLWCASLVIIGLIAKATYYVFMLGWNAL